MRLFQTKDKHEFTPLLVEIEERPTSPLGRSLLWALLAFITIGLLWLFFAKIDVVVSARGKVVPDGDIKTLQPVETGVISSILITEGQHVKKGQVLMEIDPSVTESDLASKQQNLSLLELETDRLNALIGNRPFVPNLACNEPVAISTQQLMYFSTKSAYDQQRQVLQEQLLQNNEQTLAAKEDKSRLKQLLSSAHERELRLKEVLDIIARRDYEDAKNQRIEYQEQGDMETIPWNEGWEEIEESLAKMNGIKIHRYRSTHFLFNDPFLWCYWLKLRVLVY